ncbi:Thiol-disulfide oxidoreductase ResA [uncultured archaeon]|nr:Thiol-disulfide oxidoreductase ResA [uncultured archaeon]
MGNDGLFPCPSFLLLFLFIYEMKPTSPFPTPSALEHYPNQPQRLHFLSFLLIYHYLIYDVVYPDTLQLSYIRELLDTVNMFFRQNNAPQRYRKAPEIVSTESQWINSKALTMKDLRGKTVLLDFWTYSCVNCLRTLPALKQMWKKYRNRDVVIIGVHTPEFEFEKDIANVRFAVKKHRIKYPVLNDPERINWERYGDTYWPRAELINSEWELVFEHVGDQAMMKLTGVLLKS